MSFLNLQLIAFWSMRLWFHSGWPISSKSTFVLHCNGRCHFWWHKEASVVRLFNDFKHFINGFWDLLTFWWFAQLGPKQLHDTNSWCPLRLSCLYSYQFLIEQYETSILLWLQPLIDSINIGGVIFARVRLHHELVHFEFRFNDFGRASSRTRVASAIVATWGLDERQFHSCRHQIGTGCLLGVNWDQLCRHRFDLIVPTWALSWALRWILSIIPRIPHLHSGFLFPIA